MQNALEKLKISYNYFKKNNTTFKSKIPTILTLSRALTPIIVAPLILTGNIIPALITSSVLASTDFFDGILARKFKAESTFGELLDPMVDKIFATTLIISAASINPILLINIVPEVAIAINNSKAYNENKSVRSTMLGRIKTWVLFLNILINLIPGLEASIKVLSTYLTFGLQSLTYISYKKKNKSKAIVNQTYSENITGFEDKEYKLNNKSSLRKQEIELLKYKKKLIESSRKYNYGEHFEKGKQKVKKL